MKTRNKIKVCHVLTDSAVGGAGRAVAELISATDRERFALSVVLPCGSAVRGLLECSGAELIEAPYISDRSYDARAIPVLCRIFRRIKPDIVHTHSAFSARIAARLCGVPATVMTHHCAESVKKIPFGGMLQRATATHAIAVSRGAAQALAASGMPTEMITVIPNGSSPLRTAGENEIDALRKRFGIPRNAFVAGIFGRLAPCKSHEVFVKAAALCRAKAPDMHFIVVGDGSEREKIKSLAEKAGLAGLLAGNMHFCGFCRDIAPYMALCAVNVNTTVNGEASSLAIIEGMSIGIPPVMCDTPDNRRMTAGCGILTRPGSAESTADAIMKLYRDPDMRKKLSAAAKKRYRERYTAKIFAKRTADVYLRTINGTYREIIKHRRST